jgi:hypothetical protein
MAINLAVRGASIKYGLGDQENVVLDNLNMTVRQGSM